MPLGDRAEAFDAIDDLGGGADRLLVVGLLALVGSGG